MTGPITTAVGILAAAAMTIGCGGSSRNSDDAPLVFEKDAPAKVYLDSLEQISRVPGPTFIEILEVVRASHDRLIYCTGVRGLQVVDAADPSNMRVTHELRSAKHSHQRFARCQHVAVDGDIVYATNRGDMIQKTPFISAFDLSKSPAREVVSFAPKSGTIEGIAAASGKLYVARHDGGLSIYEPKGGSLALLGNLGGFSAAWAVAVSGSRAYVADAKGSLTVVDVADPAKPVRLGVLALGGSAQSVVVWGDLAYVAIGADGFAIVDVSNPAAPAVVSETDTGGTALQITVDNKRAFIANWGDARVYDVANPAAPKLIGAEQVKTSEAGSRVLGMTGAGDVAFVGEWTGMYAYRVRADRSAPHAVVDASRVDFERTAPGAVAKAKVIVENHGTAPLTIAAPQVDGAGFALVASGDSVIEPGQFTAIELSFSPTSSDHVVGSLTIGTDDPDDKRIELDLSGNERGLGVGDAAPELPMVIDGSSWKLSEQRGKIVLLAYFATF